LAADLVRRQCAVIIAGGEASAHAAKAATATIPIVFATGDDPIKVGLVAGLNRPGGNITGISFFNGPDLESKQLELLREVVPKAGVIGVLVNPTMTAAESQEIEARVAARALGRKILTLKAGSERDFDAAFATFAQQGAGALLIAGQRALHGSARSIGRAGGALRIAYHLWSAGVRPRRRHDELWWEPHGGVSPGWRLRRPHP
jgi:putative ABC transport system substrate-binding protein